MHNIKQREGERTRAFVTRYTYDTLQILGLHKDQRISGSVHGLRTGILVEFLSTVLPTIYKGLIEKTYTWIEAREVATNRAPNNRREVFDRSKKNPSWDNNKGQKNRDKFSPYRGSNHGLLSNLSKSPREILATKKGKAKAFDTQLGEWKKGDKDTTPVEAPILMISRDNQTPKRKSVEEFVDEVGEITFPPVSSINSSYPPSIRSLQIDSKTSLVGFSEEHSWPLEEVPLEITIVSTIHGAIKFHTPRGIGIVFSARKFDKAREEQKKLKGNSQKTPKGIPSCVDTKERIVVNEKYPEQTIVIGK
ncbi:hypothetical protein Tco_1226097 [Tanacetum coccineum]